MSDRHIALADLPRTIAAMIGVHNPGDVERITISQDEIRVTRQGGDTMFIQQDAGSTMMVVVNTNV